MGRFPKVGVPFFGGFSRGYMGIFWGLGFKGTFLRVPIIRAIACWGPY